MEFHDGSWPSAELNRDDRSRTDFDRALYSNFCQTCAVPPSTNNSMPVTKLESSEARNTATLAISSALPMRPIGILATIWAMACFGSGAKIGVSIVPGLMTLARILRFLSSNVQVRTKDRIAALLAQ